jgi:RNA polymerase sigma factor (sigma-70 family)
MNSEEDRTRASLLEQLKTMSNDRAWLEFVSSYEPRIRAWCIRRKVRGEDLDDVIQTILLRLALNLPKFQYDRTRSFRAWLKTMTNREVARFWEQEERAKRDGIRAAGENSDVQRFEEVADDALSPDDTLRLREDRDCFLRACEMVRSDVHESTWKAFEQTALEKRAAAEVAAELGLTVVAVHRAKANVIARLKDAVGRFQDTGSW